MRTLFATSLLALSALATQATEIATVNMQKSFEGYYRTIVENGKFDKQEEILRDNLRQLDAKCKKLDDEFKALMKDAMNIALSDEARGEKKKLADMRRSELQSAVNELKYFVEDSKKTLAVSKEGTRNKLVEEIRQEVARLAKARKVDIVLDTSGDSNNLIPVLVYSSPTMDLTQDVLTNLNRGHEDVIKAAQEKLEKEKSPAPAAAPAPAAP